MPKLFAITPRKPNAVSEEAARRLEEAIAAKGEGVAGQASVAVVSPVHELTSSAEPSPAPVAVAAPITIEPVVTTPVDTKLLEEPTAVPEPVAAVPARNTVSSRVRNATKSQARELPTTGIGTMHNPRIRKTDGVRTRSTTVHLPIGLAQKLAVHCAMTGRKQSEVIAEAVESLLN